MIVLSIEGLKGGYGEVDILNGIDLELEAGEILTVAGTNGAGNLLLRRPWSGCCRALRGVCGSEEEMLRD